MLRSQDLGRLYSCVCGSLSLLLDLANGQSAGSQGFAVEHLKAALSTSPDQAATVLGSALAIAIHLPLNQDEQTRTSVDETYKSSVLPVIKYWERSVLHAKTSSNIPIQVGSTSARSHISC